MSLGVWISGSDDQVNLLPLCHTTKWKFFETILDKGELSTEFSKFPAPNPNGVAEEQLVYLFYGLPFYIYEVGSGNKIHSEAVDQMPIGLIFNPSLYDQVDRFYPFDTGALFSEMYQDILGLDSDEEHKLFEAEISDGNEIKRFITRYYKNNEEYCFGKVDRSVVASSPKEDNLLKLFNVAHNSKVDLRCRAVEVHSLANVDLSTHLRAVIVPRSNAQRFSNTLLDQIKKKYPKVEVVAYNDVTRFSADSSRQAILDATLLYYQEQKLVYLPFSN